LKERLELNMTVHEYLVCELRDDHMISVMKHSHRILAILRGGGHQASVVYDGIKGMYETVMVWDEANLESLHPSLKELPRFTPSGKDSILSHAKEIHCFVAVGSGPVRKKMAESVVDLFSSDRSRQLKFPTLCHISAVISPSASIGRGCFIGPFGLVHTYASIGEFCLVNSSALVEHDCNVGDFASLAPGAILLGGASLESTACLGANATVREQTQVSSGAIVGMGAAVVRNVHAIPQPGFWGGIPARPIMPFNKPPPQCEESMNKGVAKIRWCFKKSFSASRFQQYIQKSVDKGHLTNDGPLQETAQARLRSLIRTDRHMLMCANGTAALHALVTAHALKQGKLLRWVTQAFTFPSSIQGPLADALVCDIDAKMKGPSVQYLSSQRDEFDGIIVTNVFGFQTDILGYEEWCKTNGKLLVFDNAASPVGFIEDNRCIHDVGDGAIISLHETKPFGRGEGGAAIVTNEIAPYVHRAMNFGYDIPNNVRIPNRLSSNWRMSDFAAAAICDHLDTIAEEAWLCRLEELGEFAEAELERRGLCLAFAPKYPTILSCLMVKLDFTNSDVQQYDAEIICRKLNRLGIEAKHYYAPLAPRPVAPLSWSLFDSTICLPFHLQISKEEMGRMVQQLHDVVLDCQGRVSPGKDASKRIEKCESNINTESRSE
jgi:sugar O-acyltransferase (sialic acid O-acetyltransferase NeuD family)